jgi:DNA polymerase-3 subunit delta'
MTDFFGLEKQWQFLVKSTRLGKLSHAYLFSGQAGLGKRALAREFARLINCQASQEIACGNCLSCQEMEKGCHPDFLCLSAESETGEEGQIGLITGGTPPGISGILPAIRELSRWLSLRPSFGGFKVAVIEGFDQFSRSAQSALLKTIEEPEGKTVLILTSDCPEFVFPTIISRTQEIKFSPLSRERLSAYLKDRGWPPIVAEKASFFAFGKREKALQLTDSSELEKEEDKARDYLKALSSDLFVSFQKIKSVSEERTLALAFLEDIMNFLRQVFLHKIGASQAVPSPFREAADRFTAKKLKDFLTMAENTNYFLAGTGVSAQLALENLALELF